MDSSLQIYEQQQIAPVDFVKELARRLEATYIQPKKPEDCILPREFETVVEIALAEGHNPLSKTFWFWKFRGKLAVTGAYTNLVNWAQKIEPFTITYEMLSVGKSNVKNNFHCRAWLLKRGDQEAYNERMKLILSCRQPGEPIIEVMKQAKEYAQELCFMGEGVVEWAEIFYPDGKTIEQVKGWVTGETRAQRRALKNAIRQAFGEPSPGERRNLSIAALSEAKRYLSVPKEVLKVGQGDAYLKLEDRVSESREEVRQIAQESGIPEGEVLRDRRERNVQQMRGEASSMYEDILDAYYEEEVAFEEQDAGPQVPFDFTTAMDKIGLGDTKKVSALAKGLFKKKIEELGEVEKWNIYQFSKRVQAMTPEEGDGLSEADLARTIPELSGFKGKTFVEAKNTLGAIVREVTDKGQKLKELSIEF
jgi:hypothetical protein